jgi:hypothetical protein
MMDVWNGIVPLKWITVFTIMEITMVVLCVLIFISIIKDSGRKNKP